MKRDAGFEYTEMGCIWSGVVKSMIMVQSSLIPSS